MVPAGVFVPAVGALTDRGVFVSTARKPLVAGALVIALDAPPATLTLELVDCVSVELLGVF
ncbi:MAG TPA: hypothetical protein VF480_07590 [Verrucomicrobiae bacterium]